MKIIYIAGKITGNENYKDQFLAVEKMLESRGYVVLNPSMMPSGMPNNKALPICMAMIEASDDFYLIDNGWEDSAGAKTELQYAEYLGKGIIHGLGLPSLD